MQTESEEDTTPVESKRRNGFMARRIMLLLFGPFAVAVVSFYLYFTGGRFITTDNAYVHADKVAVSAEVSGPIVKLYVEENQTVHEGDILFEVDQREYLARVDKARASLHDVLTDIEGLKIQYKQYLNEIALAQIDVKLAEKEYNRMEILETKKAVSTSDLDTARHKLDADRLNVKILSNRAERILSKLQGNQDIEAGDVARARYAQAELDDALLQLKKTTVKAPFDGVVSKLPKLGRHIEPGMSVLSLIADKNFWIVANIKETKLAHIKPAQTVTISTDVYPDEEWTGVVDSINPGSGAEYSILPAQNATGNWVKVVQRIPVRIEMEYDNQNSPLRSGMSATVSVDTQYQRPIPPLISGLFTFFAPAKYAHAQESCE